MSIVGNGAFKGRKLLNPSSKLCPGDRIIGDSAGNNTDFPEMIKLIDANEQLSVQVHPDDEYARAHEGDNGKNEMWYILDAKPGAKLIYGLETRC